MKAPSSSALQNQLLTQYMQSQTALNQQTAQFQSQQQQANQAAANAVQQQQSQISSSVNTATQSPVTLGTLLTSSQGVLGNPALSYTKLGG